MFPPCGSARLLIRFSPSSLSSAGRLFALWTPSPCWWIWRPRCDASCSAPHSPSWQRPPSRCLACEVRRFGFWSESKHGWGARLPRGEQSGKATGTFTVRRLRFVGHANSVWSAKFFHMVGCESRVYIRHCKRDAH